MVKETRNNTHIEPSHEVMEAYVRENVHTLKHHYVQSLCKKSRDALSPRDGVVEVQTLIISSLDPNIVIRLAREKEIFY